MKKVRLFSRKIWNGRVNVRFLSSENNAISMVRRRTILPSHQKYYDDLYDRLRSRRKGFQIKKTVITPVLKEKMIHICRIIIAESIGKERWKIVDLRNQSKAF